MDAMNVLGIVLAVVAIVAVFVIKKKVRNDILKDRPRITDQPPFEDDDGSEQER